jgi:hypothetical protein
MESIHFAKNKQWAIEAFGGLAFNELLAREFIAARLNGKNPESVLKAIRIIM